MKLSYLDLLQLQTFHKVEESQSIFYGKEIPVLPQTSFNGGLVSHIASNYNKGNENSVRVAHSCMGFLSFTDVKVDDKVFEIVQK